MAGTATRYDSTKILAGSIGQLWANLAIPSAGARLTLHTDGTPDSTANPSAVHLGMTKAGATGKIGATVTDHFADEFPEPIKSTYDQTEMTLEGSLLQVFDEEVLKVLTVGFGTYATGSGYKEISIGSKVLTYSSIALIFPTEMDSTKFAVFHLYRAMNTSGLTIGAVSRKGEAEVPFVFKGYGIASRAATDTIGKYWFQTA